MIPLDPFLALTEHIEKQTMEFFGADLEVNQKTDASPVTIVDLKNHELLTVRLAELKNVPILSEENYPPYAERVSLSEYWLIDPLDGTKEFIQAIPEFCVLIALISQQRPKFAAIVIPAQKSVFIAEEGRGWGQFVDGVAMAESSLMGHLPPKGLVSRFHPEPEVENFYERQGVTGRSRVGSALKFCALCTGEAQVYYRHHGPHEWDIAAGDLLVTEAGGEIHSCQTLQPLQYNRCESRVDAFLATAPAFHVGS